MGSSFIAVVKVIEAVWFFSPRRWLFIVFLLVIAGIAESFGIMSLIPLLSILSEGAQGQNDRVYQIVAGFLNFIGLSVNIIAVLFIMVITAILKASFTLLAGRQVGYGAAKIGSDMRLGLIRSMLEARWTYYSSQPVGRLSNAISSESERASGVYLNISSLAAELVLVIVYVGTAFVVSWEVSLMAVTAGVLMWFLLHPTIENSRKASQEMTNTLQSLSSRFSDGIQGIKPLKAMEQKENFLRLLTWENNVLHDTLRRRVFHGWLLRSSIEPVTIIFLCIGIFFAAKYSEIQMESLLVMGFLFARSAAKIGNVQARMQAAVSNESAFRALHETIESAKSAAEILTEGDIATLENEVTFDSVDFSYHNFPVLRDVSLQVPAHQLTAFIGPSGSGKTTAIDLIVGLVEPDQGRVLVDGKSLNEIDLRAWRKSIGYVPQDPFLFHESILTNVSLGSDGVSRTDVTESLRAACAWDFISKLPQGLDTAVGERGTRLSGGQRQRIAIARALVRRPKLLILDEATTALDPATEKLVCANLKKLSYRPTIVAISHQTAIVDSADKVFRLDSGKVIEEESFNELATAIEDPNRIKNKSDDAGLAILTRPSE